MTIFLEDYKRARAANSLLPNSVYDLCISEMLGFVFRWGGKVGAEQHHFYFDQGESFRGHVVDRTIDRVKASVPAFNSIEVYAKAKPKPRISSYRWLRKTGQVKLMALATLELALNDRYGAKVKKRGAYRSFADLLAYMIQDELTYDKIPMVKRCGGSAIGFVDGTIKPSLADIRNKQAHGDPFDGFPVGGLLELVRDLITYAYRDFIIGARL